MKEEDSHAALTAYKTQMPVIATLSLTTGEGTRDAVWRDVTMEGPRDAVWWRGVSTEGPHDAVVLLERDRATLRDVVLL